MVKGLTLFILMLQAVIFDFDGVIADSERCTVAPIRPFCNLKGITLDKKDYYARYLGYDNAGLSEALAPKGSDPFLPTPTPASRSGTLIGESRRRGELVSGV